MRPQRPGDRPGERDEIRITMRGSLIGVGVVVAALLGLTVIAGVIAVAASLL